MIKKPQLLPLPISLAELKRQRLLCSQYIRPGWMGAHLTRRRGSSLEFRELQAYQIGDDLRHVDWHASARQGGLTLGMAGWLQRRFEADERLTVALSLDMRPTLWLPDGRGISKFQIGAWACEALATMVLTSQTAGDQVVFHRLFGGRRQALQFSGNRNLARLGRDIRSLATAGPEVESETNLGAIWPQLPPTAVWIIFTDLYFKAQADYLISRLIEARSGNRWVIVVELDSWLYEKELLAAKRPARVIYPDQSTALPIGPDSVAAAETELQNYLERQRQRLKAGGISLVQWQWPKQGIPDLKDWLFKTKTFQTLFKREAW